MKKYYLIIIGLLLSVFVHAQALWKEVGPVLFPTNQSGQINGQARVTQLKFHPSLPNKMYTTSASGGLYTTIDTGHHWTLLGTDSIALANLASVCIDHTNDQIIYIGTGDPNYYTTDMGILKSSNGGATWTAANNGLSNNMAVEILMDPSNNQHVVIATNNGIFKTTDAAATWVNVKPGSNFCDMVRIPGTNTLLASTRNSLLFRSTDFGSTWSPITATSFAQSGADGTRICTNTVSPNTVYLVTNGANGVVYKSIDAGLNFSLVYSSTTQCLVCYDENPLNAGQGNYNFAAVCDPLNANHLYVAAQCLWESNDGGLTFFRNTAWPQELHTDHHQFVFSPYNNDKFYSANDGGVWIREGLNDSLWEPLSDGITAMEMYKAANSPVERKLVSAGTQDNGEVYYKSTGWYTNRGGDWTSRMLFDYNIPGNVYYLGNGKRRQVNPNGGEQDYNTPFTATSNARIAFCKGNTNVSVLGKDSIYVSNNVSALTPTWNLIHPTTTAIRDVVISTADSTIAFVVNSNKIIRLTNLLSIPIVTVTNTPTSASVRGSVATVKSNANILYMSGNAKVYRSTDQGATFTNVTYNLPNVNILKIYHDDFSSDERMYVCSGNQIFTKTINDTIWQNISLNLPKIANINDFMLFNDGTVASKLRVAYYGRGVWEYLLHPNYPPVADFKAANNTICPGKTVQFNNESVEDSLTYNWVFTGGTPNSSTAENPIVTYNTAGLFTVSLTVTSPNGTDTKTLTNFINVLSGNPMVDSMPGKALKLDGTASSLANAGKLNLNTNTATIMCWMKPQGVQNDWAGLVFARGNKASGISIKDDNEIRYHWNDTGWPFSTGLYADSNEWNHCAVVVTPTAVTVYVNGVGSTDSTNVPLASFFTDDLIFGADNNGGGRRFKGLIDEVCFYNRALTQAEIRMQMHLVKSNLNVADSLKGYWQMNELTSSNSILNKANCENQASLTNTNALVKSTGPFGGGKSEVKNISNGGMVNASLTDMNLEFPSVGLYPDGDVYITHLTNEPDTMPGGLPSAGNYWIVDNYGLNKNINMLVSLELLKAGYIIDSANQYQLYSRTSNSYGPTWGNALCTATSKIGGVDGSVLFTGNTNIQSLGQFAITGPFTPAGIVEHGLEALFNIYPNPAHDALSIVPKSNEAYDVVIQTADGKKVFEQNRTTGKLIVSCTAWAKGIYFYTIHLNGKKMNGKLLVE